MEEPRPENRAAEVRLDAATSGMPAAGEITAEIGDSTPLFVYGTLMNKQVGLHRRPRTRAGIAYQRQRASCLRMLSMSANKQLAVCSATARRMDP